MNLFLCLVWSALGIYLIVVHATNPDYLSFRLPFPGQPSGGWLALLLAAYNFIQWWTRESLRKQRLQAQREEAERRERHLREHRQEAGQVPDPNFQFTDEVPPPGNS
jgi:hypothetical protein